MISQSAVTIMTDILAGHENALQKLLEDAAADAANNNLVPFGVFTSVHFARFFIMPPASDLTGRPLAARLVFLADVDGAASTFLHELVDRAAAGLDTIFSHCAGYHGRSTLLPFLHQHRLASTAKYVNTIGRTVEQVHQEATLREMLRGYLDRHATNFRGTSPRRVRAALQEFVEQEPTLAWARRPASGPDSAYFLGETLHLAVTTIAGIVLFPLVLAGLPLWLYLLRRHETQDITRDVAPSDELVETLAAQEDHGVQNPFTSAGLLKPGPFRRFTASVVLWGTNFLARHVFNHADLIGVKTIHFARWIFIDQKRRVIFASSYDGSLENYMDDFIDKIAWGLNATFSNGFDYPRTNWLILDGARDEQIFKRFNLTHQLVTQFWYAGYQGLTALNIENNARIRAGLYGALDEAATRAWLQRL
ncbi:MAG TPA: hypothetical protein VGQ62_06115 [Chloroflexota bacterium]|nr:hypothetical protein [Chloroflexota bacterium]